MLQIPIRNTQKKVQQVNLSMENWREIKKKSVKGEERVQGKPGKGEGEGRREEEVRERGKEEKGRERGSGGGRREGGGEGSLREYPMPKPQIRPQPEFHLEDTA